MNLTPVPTLDSLGKMLRQREDNIRKIIKILNVWLNFRENIEEKAFVLHKISLRVCIKRSAQVRRKSHNGEEESQVYKATLKKSAPRYK